MNKKNLLPDEWNIFKSICLSSLLQWKLSWYDKRSNLFYIIIFFGSWSFVYIFYFFTSPDIHPKNLEISAAVEFPTLNMIDTLLPQQMTNNLVMNFGSKSQTTLVYVCLGERAFTNHQKYIWKSLEQARLVVDLSLPIVLIISEAGQSAKIRKHLEQLNITLVIYEDLLSANNYTFPLYNDFQQNFFVQGAMEPGGNVDFNRLTTERLFALHAYMKITGKSDVFHIENDNMLYGNLVSLMHRMRVCQVSLGLLRASKEDAIVSFMYARNAYAIEHFLNYIVGVFRMKQTKAIMYMNTTWINEMTITARYLDRFAATHEVSKLSGIFELPTQMIDRNCCLCHPDEYGESIVFDARTLGRYFGGDYHKPAYPFYWTKSEYVDPRGYRLVWNRKKKVRLPYISGFRVMNLHVHSKRLQKFSSIGDRQVTGENFNSSLVYN